MCGIKERDRVDGARGDQKRPTATIRIRRKFQLVDDTEWQRLQHTDLSPHTLMTLEVSNSTLNLEPCIAYILRRLKTNSSTWLNYERESVNNQDEPARLKRHSLTSNQSLQTGQLDFFSLTAWWDINGYLCSPQCKRYFQDKVEVSLTKRIRF